jgi:hypothetical protein
MKKVYYIWVWDPRSTDHSFDGREFIDSSKGAFLNKEVAEEIINGMRMFQDVDDPCTFSVRELNLNEEATFEEWMENKGPGRRRAG